MLEEVLGDSWLGYLAHVWACNPGFARQPRWGAREHRRAVVGLYAAHPDDGFSMRSRTSRLRRSQCGPKRAFAPQSKGVALGPSGVLPRKRLSWGPQDTGVLHCFFSIRLLQRISLPWSQPFAVRSVLLIVLMWFPMLAACHLFRAWRPHGRTLDTTYALGSRP